MLDTDETKALANTLDYLTALNIETKEKLIGLCLNRNLFDEETEWETEIDNKEDDEQEEEELEEELKYIILFIKYVTDKN